MLLLKIFWVDPEKSLASFRDRYAFKSNISHYLICPLEPLNSPPHLKLPSKGTTVLLIYHAGILAEEQ